jgi:hypothetical protein
LGLVRPLKYLLLAGCVPVVVALWTCWAEPKYILPNLAYFAAPQLIWWLFCVIWWSCWRPPRNPGLFIGGVLPVDFLLVYVALSPGDSLKWFSYLYGAPMALVAGGLVGGLCGRLFRRPQPSASPNGGPGTLFGNAEASEGPPSVS